MIRTYSLTCPNGGADLNMQEDRRFIFCEYCGHKIFFEDDSIKKIEITKNINVFKNERKVIENKAEMLKNLEGALTPIVFIVWIIITFILLMVSEHL